MLLTEYRLALQRLGDASSAIEDAIANQDDFDDAWRVMGNLQRQCENLRALIVTHIGTHGEAASAVTASE